MDTASNWDFLAPGYAEKRGFGRGLMPAEKRMLRKILAKAGNGPVLDVGCGPGRHVRFTNSMGINALGIDFSLGMLSEGRKLGNEQYVLGDACAMPFASCSFGSVICMGNTIGSVDDPQKLAGEMLRVCKRSLLIDFRHEKGKKGSLKRGFDEGSYDIRVWTPGEAMSMLSTLSGDLEISLEKGQEVERGFFFYAIIRKNAIDDLYDSSA